MCNIDSLRKIVDRSGQDVFGLPTRPNRLKTRKAEILIFPFRRYLMDFIYIVDTMLTKKKFKDFFQKNVAAL